MSLKQESKNPDIWDAGTSNWHFAYIVYMINC